MRHQFGESRGEARCGGGALRADQVGAAPAVFRLEAAYFVAPRQQFAQHAAQEMGVAVVPAGNQRLGEQDEAHASSRLCCAACACCAARAPQVAMHVPRAVDHPLGRVFARARVRAASPSAAQRGGLSSRRRSTRRSPAASSGCTNTAAPSQSSRKRGYVGQHQRRAGLRGFQHRRGRRARSARARRTPRRARIRGATAASSSAPSSTQMAEGRAGAIRAAHRAGGAHRVSSPAAAAASSTAMFLASSHSRPAVSACGCGSRRQWHAVRGRWGRHARAGRRRRPRAAQRRTRGWARSPHPPRPGRARRTPARQARSGGSGAVAAHRAPPGGDAGMRHRDHRHGPAAPAAKAGVCSWTVSAPSCARHAAPVRRRRLKRRPHRSASQSSGRRCPSAPPRTPRASARCRGVRRRAHDHEVTAAPRAESPCASSRQYRHTPPTASVVSITRAGDVSALSTVAAPVPAAAAACPPGCR